MEYIVSARKYRPLNFDSVVGQQSLTVTLKNAVQTKKLAHAYLFCGPRGVGKTTCARIFAKVINCMSPLADGDACGECESCKAFAEQRSLNIFELDAASNNGVEHIRQLMEQTRVPPQIGIYKVFIIDEVHMLSSAAFNAFLKTLEEPPVHVIFILATTEKHKILPTILSRCQVFDFQRMTVEGIVNHLKTVADDQGVTYEEEALRLIAEKADGGMRDALSIFDQAVSFCQGNITYQKVLEDLNVLDVDNYFKAIDLALECKAMEEMVLLNSVLERGFDAGQFITGLASHIRNVLMARNAQTAKLIDISETQRQRYQEQAQRCKIQFLYNALKILNQCDINYRQSTNKRLLVELTLIEFAQLLQEDDASGVGRGPNKKLKTLFKKIITQVQSATNVSQVTKTEQGNSTDNKEQKATTPHVATPPKVNTSSITTSISSVGMSFGNMLKQDKNTVIEVKEEKNIEENENFTENDVRMQWLAMCNRMALTQMVSLSKRLKNIIPSITEFPNIEIVLENELLKEEISNIRRRIEITLAQKLHNGNIKLNIRLAKTEEIKQLLTPKQKLEMLITESSLAKELMEKLQLELD